MAIARIETNKVIVVDFEIEVVMPQSHAAIAGVRAAASLPVILPEDRAVARIDSPGIIRRGHIEDSVYHEDAAAHARIPAGVQVPRAQPANHHGMDRGSAASAAVADISIRARA